jgi:hypothetical protein
MQVPRVFLNVGKILQDSMASPAFVDTATDSWNQGAVVAFVGSLSGSYGEHCNPSL